MKILVKRSGLLKISQYYFQCNLGKNGVTFNKKEGDDKTPLGTFPLNFVMYRSDRISKPKTNLKIINIKKNHVCCDDPKDLNYNKIFQTNNINISEKLWRNDSLYDILIVIGYNYNQVIKNKGSAIFLHLNKKNYNSTKGCISIKKENMIKLLKYSPKKIQII